MLKAFCKLGCRYEIYKCRIYDEIRKKWKRFEIILQIVWNLNMSWVLRVITLPPPKHSNIMIEIKPWQNEFSLPKNFSSKITHEMGGHILQQVLLVEFLVSEVWDHRLPQAFLSMAENRSAAIWSFGSPGSYLFYPFIYFKVWPVPFHALSPTIIRTTCRHILPWYGPSPFELLASPS